LFAESPMSSSFCLSRSVRLPVEPALPGLLLDPAPLLEPGFLGDAPYPLELLELPEADLPMLLELRSLPELPKPDFEPSACELPSCELPDPLRDEPGLSDDEPLMLSLCLSWRSVIVSSPHIMSLVSAPFHSSPADPVARHFAATVPSVY